MGFFNKYIRSRLYDGHYSMTAIMVMVGVALTVFMILVWLLTFVVEVMWGRVIVIDVNFYNFMGMVVAGCFGFRAIQVGMENIGNKERTYNTSKAEVKDKKDTEKPKTTKIDAVKNAVFKSTKVPKGLNMADFLSKDGTPMTKQEEKNMIEVMLQLEVLAEHLNKPLEDFSISSGHRAKAYNQKLIDEYNKAIKEGKKPRTKKPATNSQHLYAKAVDFKVKGITAGRIQNTLSLLMDEGKIIKGGIGKASTFTHYDTRGTKTIFTYA